jgi:hypothetical protein
MTLSIADFRLTIEINSDCHFRLAIEVSSKSPTIDEFCKEA